MAQALVPRCCRSARRRRQRRGRHRVRIVAPARREQYLQLFSQIPHGATVGVNGLSGSVRFIFAEGGLLAIGPGWAKGIEFLPSQPTRWGSSRIILTIPPYFPRAFPCNRSMRIGICSSRRMTNSLAGLSRRWEPNAYLHRPPATFQSPDPLVMRKVRPPDFSKVIRPTPIAMWLRDFCGSRWCFVLPSGDKCNSIPAAVV
jgi:hypothetical protein